MLKMAAMVRLRGSAAFGDLHLPAQQINQIFGVALIEHGKVAIDTCLLGELS